MTVQPEQQPRKFSNQALAEATAVVQRSVEIVQERPAAQGITIDGPTSKDLDDALWLERQPHGGYLLHISIADAGAFINSNLAPTLDQEAFQRSFTRYYADRNLPMLPATLSEDRLSLFEGQARPAITFTIPLDAQLTPGEPEIRQTCLCSSKRFSYDEVDHEINKPRTEFARMLQDAYLIAQKLLKGRRAQGALAIYDLHSGWATTEEGLLIKLVAGERNKAHIIIQEFMILTNQVLALYFAHRGVLALYRNHAAKIIAPERASLLQMIDTAVSHPELANPERVRTTVNLAMERARYGSTVTGHFGLNLPAYVHMTSPLRRYPDLVNHRILLALLQGAPPPYTKEELDRIAAHVNEVENTIKDARRAHFLAEHDSQIRKTVAVASQDPATATRPLGNLDAKQFHSTIRMAAESHELQPIVEQEIFTRLQEETLQAHDVFTLVFRFPNSGEAWDRVKRACILWLQQHPYHALSILMMGQQSLGWEVPPYDVTSSSSTYQGGFQAIVTVRINGRSYTSPPQVASQKELAKQLACARLLAMVAGVELPETSVSQDHTEASAASPTGDEQAVLDTETTPLQNYKGQILELAQVRKWRFPSYIEISRSGPSHAPVFTVKGKIVIDGTEYVAQGTGPTKARAEQEAAKNLFPLLPQAPAQRSPASTGKNVVSILNEMQQKRAIASVTYSYTSSGPSNDPTFTCTCIVTRSTGDSVQASSSAKTKKEAAASAAAEVLTALSSPSQD